MLAKSRFRILYAGALFGMLLGGVTLWAKTLDSVSDSAVLGVLRRMVMILIIPGLLGSTIASNNSHAFSLIVAAVINSIIYWLIGSAVGFFTMKARRPKI